MPLILSDVGVSNLIAHYQRDQNYAQLFRTLWLLQTFCQRFLKLIIAWPLLQQIVFPLFRANTEGTTEHGVSAVVAYKVNANEQASTTAKYPSRDTIITIENNERAPLLGQKWRVRDYGGGGGGRGYGENNQGSSDGSNNSIATTGASTTLGNYKAKQNRLCDLQLITFVATVLTGLVIAIYLLVQQTRLPSLRFSLDLVNHDIWSKISIPLGGLLNHTNVMNAVFTQTGGKECTQTEECLSILRQMQAQTRNAAELSYNFLIGGDGLTYEVHGWEHGTDFDRLPQGTSLVIGFIGNYTVTPPNEMQLQTALTLLRESVRRKKLQSQYKVYALRNTTDSCADAHALYRSISKWQRFKDLL